MRHHRQRETTINLLIGASVGFLIHFLSYNSGSDSEPASLSERIGNAVHSPSKANLRQFQDVQRNLLFTGVMTAQKYLDTRAVSVFRTWGKRIPGRIAFFSSANSSSDFKDFPVVALSGVDDSYPPQKKSFLMLKYMFDHFIDEFEWFMRADDDMYVKTDKLEEFLRSLNSSRPLFIGQAGMGNKQEFGMLSLQPGENFCMGGPGIIMSRETLRRLAPHIKYCLKHLYSTHEDVEVGRCINKFVGIPCAWSYEMQTIFYHNQSGSLAFTGDLHTKEVRRAITLHPVKSSEHLYRLQNYFDTLKLTDLRHEIYNLKRTSQSMQDLLQLGPSRAVSPGLNQFRPRSPEEVLEWEFISKSWYSRRDTNPKRTLRSSMKWALNDQIMQMMESINQYSRQRGRIIDFKELLYGYQRLDPLHGVHYVLDLHLVYKRYQGKKATVPVRRHAYLEQAFTGNEFMEELECDPRSPTSSMPRSLLSQSDPALEKLESCQDLHSKRVNLILPLSGRMETFRRFLQNLNNRLLSKGENISLNVVHFPDASNETDPAAVAAQVFGMRRSLDIRLQKLPGNFSRAFALQSGAKAYSPDELLLFVDVDMEFDQGFLDRVRRETRIGMSVYYPIVFSQYQPQKVSAEVTGDLLFDDDSGYWRAFGFGIVSLYRRDFDAVGGFDLSIKGWGKEDVDLYEKFLKLQSSNPNFVVFRAVDPGIVHIYHSIECDPGLDSSQMLMCVGSKAASMHPESFFVRRLLDDRRLLEANWPNTTSANIL